MKSSRLEGQPFLSDIESIRKRARELILSGAVTDDYGLDTEHACRVLNEALATEIVCVLRYKSHYYRAEGIHAEAVKEEFWEHSGEEQEHADWIAERIKQLGGMPDLNPDSLLARSHAEFTGGNTLVELLREDLIAERVAIESYREMIQWFGAADPTTRRLLERILEKEEEHADELADLLKSLNIEEESAKSQSAA